MSSTATATPTTREAVIELIRKLPDDVTVADIMATLYTRHAIEEGMAQLDQGQGIPHDQVMARVAKWLQ
jgi:predicted transcriptional regulator